MLILELTLGQKMQKGSAGAIRGITPRLGGIGWVASFAGFITALVYCIFLSIACIYLVTNGSEPWNMAWEDRPIGCKTARSAATTGAEIFLYLNIAKYYSPDTCKPFEYGKESFKFAGELFIAVLIVWVICFFCIFKGVKSIQAVTMISVPAPFIFLFACMAYYISLNKANVSAGQATGLDFYWGKEGFPLISPDKYGNLYYDPAQFADKRFGDAVNHAFFSVGVCVGVMAAYASYHPIKAPVIRNSFIIVASDFTFSILAGFLAWSVIGFLQAKNNITYAQTSSTGLTFIAFPVAATLDEGGRAWFGVFMFLMFIAGIDSAFSYMESVVTNVIDFTRCTR